MSGSAPLPYTSVGNWSAEIQKLGEEYHTLLFSLHSLLQSEFDRRLTSLATAASTLSLPSLNFAVSRLRHYREFGISSVNVGGPMGCGKSNFAEYLQAHLKFKFRDADYFHTDEARVKMSQGIPLSDADRFPFLSAGQEWLRQPRSITTCSALRTLYRAILFGQRAEVSLYPDDSRRVTPWEISDPHKGLLLIILLKPYEYALRELDLAFHSSTPRMFDGKPHFVQVNRESENAAATEGKTPLLRSQYDAIEKDPPLPWDALCIDVGKLRDSHSQYKVTATLHSLLTLPFATGLAGCT